MGIGDLLKSKAGVRSAGTPRAGGGRAVRQLDVTNVRLRDTTNVRLRDVASARLRAGTPARLPMSAIAITVWSDTTSAHLT